MNVRARLRSLEVLGLALLVAVTLRSGAARAAPMPSFGHAALVSRDGNPELLVDGMPFFFWGGAFFYERIPASQWRSSMLAMKRLGANTLDLYVPWNWHELDDGDFDFDGHTNPRRNLREVLRLARELGLHLIVRPGPVIRNEWRNGGYPAWLLIRPEYHMPLRDVLDGRYPATATLQNARSDDAAAEWMANRTHLRYASRWLHRALAEFRPVADLVLAVALDDDQAAYIDNQTSPAPHLRRYLSWLESQVRDVVGPTTPTFINTYEMRVPASSPVWTMGNWYQSDAFSIGEHDRAGLDFATLLLATNRRGPPAQSEFQAGWLAPPEDPQPRPADPSNTELALHELLARGVHGVVDFPMQDTLAPFGWEAPFSNALYNWDAAIGLSGRSFGSRYEPTAAFGSLLGGAGSNDQNAADPVGFGLLLAETSPVYDAAIAWLAGAYTHALTPAEIRAITDRTTAELQRCRQGGRSCLLVDLREPLPHVSTLVVPRAIAAPLSAAASMAVRLFRSQRGTVVSAISLGRRGSIVDTTILAGTHAAFVDLRNWSREVVAMDATMYAADSESYTLPPLRIAPRAALLLPLRVDLSTMPGFAPGDALRPSTCPLLLGRGQLTVLPGRNAPCSLGAVLAGRVVTAQVESAQGLVVEANGLQRAYVPKLMTIGHVTAWVPGIHLAPDASFEPQQLPRHDPVPLDVTSPLIGNSFAVRADVFGDGAGTIVLQNEYLRAIVSPDGGGRLVELGGGNGGRDRNNATDATGALRDDVIPTQPPSARDYIAAYTHGYPSGTAQRRYAATIVQSGARAIVHLHYVDLAAGLPVTYDRILTLEPRTRRLIVDERVTIAGNVPTSVRAVQRSSLPGLLVAAGDSELFPPRESARSAIAASYRAGSAHVMVVTWKRGDVTRATWKRYRSTGTLSLLMTLRAWHRVVYAFAPAASPAQARTFAQAERAWVSANPVTARSGGEVAKW